MRLDLGTPHGYTAPLEVASLRPQHAADESSDVSSEVPPDYPPVGGPTGTGHVFSYLGNQYPFGFQPKKTPWHRLSAAPEQPAPPPRPQPPSGWSGRR